MKKYLTIIIIVCVIAWVGSYLHRLDTEAGKWNRFLECSKDEGDMGCDSCFFMVFGYHAEAAGYLDYTPAQDDDLHIEIQRVK